MSCGVMLNEQGVLTDLLERLMMNLTGVLFRSRGCPADPN